MTMKTDEGSGKYVELIVHLPAAFKQADQERAIKALQEVFFGQDQLAPHVAKQLEGRVDPSKINSMLAEERSGADAAPTPHFEMLARDKEFPLDKGRAAFQVRLNPVSEGSLQTFVSDLKGIDGRKAMFVTLRPHGFSIASEEELAVLVNGAFGSCQTHDFPDRVKQLLSDSGIDMEAIRNNPAAPLTRLSEESRELLANYGIHEHEFGSISVMIDPNSAKDQPIASDIIRRRALTHDDFALESDSVN